MNAEPVPPRAGRHGPDGYLQVWISAELWSAGLMLNRQGNKCAPVLHYMKFWPLSQIRNYCRDQGWKLEVFDTRTREPSPIEGGENDTGVS